LAGTIAPISGRKEAFRKAELSAILLAAESVVGCSKHGKFDTLCTVKAKVNFTVYYRYNRSEFNFLQSLFHQNKKKSVFFYDATGS
jgi:hypothetical protein